MKSEKKLPTVEELENLGYGYDIDKVKEYCQNFYPPAVQNPKEPVLNPVHTSSEAETYVNKLKSYEVEKSIADKVSDERFGIIKAIDLVIKEYVKRSAGLYSIPKQYQDKVFCQAWDDGHSHGWSEVHSKLCELVGIFN